MKIYYMSDLHKDINGDYIEKLKIPDDAEESILLLAGDLHSKGRCASVADYFADFYKYVVWVYGNHSWYQIAMHETHKFLSNKINVYHLENQKIILDGISIVGCTLWHPIKTVDEFDWKYYLNDARYIRGRNFRKLDYRDIDFLYHQSIGYLANTQADILLTHHGLHNNSISLAYADAPTNKYYITHRPDILENFKFHVHGHVHSSFDYIVTHDNNRTTNVLTNPLGYCSFYKSVYEPEIQVQKENKQFNELKYFEINK